MTTIELPWLKPPLNLNQRLHWAQKAKETKLIRSTVAVLARGRVIPLPCVVTLVWTVSDARRRDTDNPAPTVKACIDGMRDAGLLPDDHSGYVVGSGTRIETVRGVKAMRLEIAAAPERETTERLSPPALAHHPRKAI